MDYKVSKFMASQHGLMASQGMTPSLHRGTTFVRSACFQIPVFFSNCFTVLVALWLRHNKHSGCVQAPKQPGYSLENTVVWVKNTPFHNTIVLQVSGNQFRPLKLKLTDCRIMISMHFKFLVVSLSASQKK